MKSFSNTMAEDNYNTSQSNLNALAAEQQRELPQAELRRQASQQSNELLGPGRTSARTTRIADEMSTDLQYLSREAPLDGGESTFGAYSTLGGGQSSQQLPGDELGQPASNTMTRETSYRSTMTRTSSTPLGHEHELLSDEDEHNRLENDYERTDFRIDDDDEDEQDRHYNQRGRADSAARSHSQQQQQQQQFGMDPQQQLEQLAPDNVDIQRPLQQAGFLVSFMVDARGGAMRGCRHSGVRVIIPPNTAPQPMRITCRYLRRERLVHPPPLMEGEACASKIMEVGPAGARFLGPVLIEVPHFASLRGKEREIIILRSDSGEVWREHLFETDDQLIESIISAAELVEQQQNPYATGQDLDQDQENQRPSSAIGQSSQRSGLTSGGVGGGGGGGDVQQEKRLTRIVTNEFPQYFAIISRVRQEVHTVGPDGLAVDSQVVPRVQAVFTDGALTKRIKIGLQKKEAGSGGDGGGGGGGGTPEPASNQTADRNGETPDGGRERTRSPSRPNSAQAKRRSRFLACFGASHGSHDLLDQSGTDAEGFASGSNESSSSSGGDSPRQLAKEELVERRHILEDLTDSEADEPNNKKVLLAGLNRKKRSATGSQLVPDDYYIEPEPAFILNLRPKTYGKRLQSSSAQTDQKLQSNGLLSTSARSPKRRGVNLLSAAKRRRNKIQMQIPFHEPRPSSQRAASRAKSVELVDSSLESQIEADDLNQEADSADEKWRTCTIQTDSDSVTVQYVTISNSTNPIEQQQQQQVAVESKATATGGQDDGYVSGSGDLKRGAAAAAAATTPTSDQTNAKTGLKSGLFLPFCSTTSADDDDDDLDNESSRRAADSKQKLKKSSKKEKKAKKESGGGSGKSSPAKLDVVPEAKVESDESKVSPAGATVEEIPQQEPKSQVAAAAEAQLSAGEEADESLLTTTTTTTSRSISPTSKEQKRRLKLEKREKIKREKLEKQKQKELDEANAKAAKAQKKLEKEAKRKAEKEEKLAKKAAATAAGSREQSPGESRAQSPASEQAASKDEAGGGGGVLGAITKTIQSVKFAPSPSKDSVKDEPQAVANGNQDEPEDSSMVHVSIGTESNLLTEGAARSEATSDADQLISFSPEPTEVGSLPGEQTTTTTTTTTKVLKPILKQQHSGSIDRELESNLSLEAEPELMAEVIGDKLVDEATNEAVRAVCALQQAQVESSSSPSSPSSLSESKKEAAKRLKAEREQLKAELKLSVDEEKRLAKEAKRLAKQAEEAAKKAEHEARKAALEAQEEAERQAEIAKREAEAAIKLIESPQRQQQQQQKQTESPQASAPSDETEAKPNKAELKRQAKEAELEAKRLAKEAKKQAKEAAAREKDRLKAEKKRAKLGAEPSAPSLEMISESSPEALSKSSASEPKQQQQQQSEKEPVDDGKTVPLGLPRVSFDLSRSEPQLKPEEQVADELVQAAEATSSPYATEDEVAEEAAKSPEQAVTEVVSEQEASSKSETVVGVVSDSSESKKSKKKQKKQRKEKVASQSDESSAADAISKSSGSFFGRLFRAKPKQKQSRDEPQEQASEEDPEVADLMQQQQQQQQQQEMMIVSEMYPSDPNNADGEMILEVNVPEELISEASRQVQPVESSSPRQQEGGVTSASAVVTTATGVETTEPTDDQEATLVNLSQMKDDVNEDEDDEATENVLSQANDLVEEAPTEAQVEQVRASPPSVEAVEKPGEGANVEPGQQVAQADAQVEAAPEPQAAGSSRVSKELAKDEKARKELEAKLEKEAKKRLKEEEKERKKQEKAEKKRAESEAKKQAKEEKERQKREAKEAKKAAEKAKKEAKKAGKKKAQPVETGAEAAQEPSGVEGANEAEDANRPTTLTTTTITSTATIVGDERALNDDIGREGNPADGRIIMSSVSEIPINEETEVERIVEEVVGEDGTVTKTTKLVETKYVTMRQEEIRVAERRDMPLEEWQRIQAERASTSGGDTQLIERRSDEQQQQQPPPPPQVAAAVQSAELEEICATPSYFDLTTRPAEIKPECSEKKAMRKRIKLNEKLIKRAHKLAKLELKRAKRDQRRAEAEIAVCDEAARQARKELKSAVKEAKRAAKLTEKQHKKMDKVDKKLSKRAKELEKRQKKIDKQVAKAAKKQAKREAKAAKKAAKLARSNSGKSGGSGSSRSPSRSSKRSLRPEDISEPVLRSSSRLSIVQSNPNVELSLQQPPELSPELAPQVVGAPVELGDEPIDVLHGGASVEVAQMLSQSVGEPQPEAEAMRAELGAVKDEDDSLINVVDDDDDDDDNNNNPEADGERAPQASPSPESNAAEEPAEESASPSSGTGGKGKKNRRRNKKQKSKESAE